MKQASIVKMNKSVSSNIDLKRDNCTKQIMEDNLSLWEDISRVALYLGKIFYTAYLTLEKRMKFSR